MSGLILLAIVVGILVLAGAWGVGVYNGLVTARNAFRNAFAQIDVQLQRRFDLIPNLVETAKGYLTHERQTLEAVIAARGAAVSGLAAAKASPGDPAAMAELGQTQGMLNSALGRLLAVAEAYPDLKANQNFLELQSQLAGPENRINVARKDFNDAAKEYNVAIRRFPKSLIAGICGFDKKNYFEAEAGADKAPKVEF